VFSETVEVVIYTFTDLAAKVAYGLLVCAGILRATQTAAS
jgi:hypothetical protein